MIMMKSSGSIDPNKSREFCAGLLSGVPSGTVASFWPAEGLPEQAPVGGSCLSHMKRLVVAFVLSLPVIASADPDCGTSGQPCTGRSHTHVVDGTTFTWRYSCDGGECQHGRFLDGTAWVRSSSGGNVLIEQVSPDDDISGLEKNPATGDKARSFRQGLYARSGADSTYDATLDLSQRLPYAASPDDAVYVKAKAYTGGDCGYTSAVGSNCLETFDAITVVKSIPSDGDFGRRTFRPGMSGSTKVWVTTDDVDLSRLPAIAAVSPGDYQGIVRRWGAPFPSFYGGRNADHGRRWAPKARGLHSYAADRAEQALIDLFGLLGSDALSDTKARAAYAIAQYGLDVYSGYREGVEYSGGAGQGQGYWHPMVFFGALVNNPDIAEHIRGAHSGGFAEFSQIRVGKGGTPLWGDDCVGGGLPSGHGFYWSTYAHGKLGRTGSSSRTCRDPYGYIDGPGERPGTFYAQCCSAGVYVSIGLLMKIWPEFDRMANNPPLRQFAERVMDGAGWWAAGDRLAGIDPRESTGCNPYRATDAARNCVYWGVTWGERPDGSPVTIEDARKAGHPSPGPRWSESDYHLQGRPALDRERPGYQYWDRLKQGQTPDAPTRLRVQ